MTDEAATTSEAPVTPAWYGDSHKGFVELKGWSAPDDVIQSYANLEKLVGADRAGRTVVLPKGDDDAEGWQSFKAKLGVPDAPEKYGIAPPEGSDPAFVERASKAFLDAGLTPKQAKALEAFWSGEVQGATTIQTAAQEKAQAEFEANAAKALESLKGEWGEKYSAREQGARNAAAMAAQNVGIDAAKLEALEKAWGTAETLKVFDWIASMMAPDRIEAGKPTTIGYSPEAAREKLKQLMDDREWLNRWASGDRAARAEKDMLDNAILRATAA